MIRITPEAALEIIEARAYYRSHGADDDAFELVANHLLDEIEARFRSRGPSRSLTSS